MRTTLEVDRDREMTGDDGWRSVRLTMVLEYLPKASLLPQASYVRELRAELPAKVFEPARSRLAFVPLYLASITISALAISTHWAPWPLVPLLSIVIGVSFAGLTFIAHETVHGGIVRGHTARYIVAWVGFSLFTVSPRLWAAWHDRVHHANANRAADPDVYPTLAEYRASRRVRLLVDAFSMGGRRWRGVFSLLLGFTVQSAHQLVVARRCGLLKPRAFAFAAAETLAGIALWMIVAVAIGFVSFVFVFVIPLLIANAIVMAFILTNHSLSPRVEINDPLVSGLSVTAPRWIEWVTLKFGYHVEHHLFPAMSSRYARRVRDVLRRRWPQRYQSMPLWIALRELHRTARVYKDAVTLIDPRTRQEFPTLMPG
jgi:fatty acid desaturase